MNKKHTDIVVAAYGWQYPDWNESFYPEDLPEDWRLSFYSNEFRAVVVPASVWVGDDPLDAERWVEDVSDEFTFYLEVVDILADWVKISAAAKPFGKKLAGILLRPVTLDADLAMIASSLDAATALAPVCLLLPEKMELSETGNSLLLEQGVSVCWDTAKGVPVWSQGGFAVARVANNMECTPRQWREIIEQCLRCEIVGEPENEVSTEAGAGIKRKVLLMVEHKSLNLDSLRAAMMIGDMLVVPRID